MNWRQACLFALLCAFHLVSMAQQPDIPDLHKLSPVDSALLELYRDSFQNELAGFLNMFGAPNFKKFDTTVSSMDKSSHAEVSLGFASRILAYGRDEGISGVGFFPSASYYHKYGFFVGLGMVFYTDPAIASQTPIPVIAPYAGFQRSFFKRWLLGLAYSRSILGYGSVESEDMLNNDISFSTSVDVWKRLIIGASAYVDWSSLHQGSLPAFEKYSLEFPVFLRKEFLIYKFIGAKFFTITPAVTAWFATDNLPFIRQREVAEQTGAPLSIYTTSVANFFGFVDIEPSLSLDWRIRNLDIFVLPALAIPFNEFDYQTSSRVTNPKEYRFYAQAGIKYLFHVNKIMKKK